MLDYLTLTAGARGCSARTESSDPVGLSSAPGFCRVRAVAGVVGRVGARGRWFFCVGVASGLRPARVPTGMCPGRKLRRAACWREVVDSHRRPVVSAHAASETGGEKSRNLLATTTTAGFSFTSSFDLLLSSLWAVAMIIFPLLLY